MNRRQHLQAFALAWALMTRLPLPSAVFPATITASLKTLSSLYFPIVGCILAVLLSASLTVFIQLELQPLTVATLLVSLWVFLTGAMHLDGLADASDAAFVAHKSPSDISRVFKDPHIGPMAVVVLIVVLFLKIALLSDIISAVTVRPFSLTYAYGYCLFLPLVLSRLMALWYMASTPYISKHGLASEMEPEQKRHFIGVQTLLFTVVCFYSFGPIPSIICGLLATACSYYWRRKWLRLLQGYNGDCVGALIELVELSCLLGMAVTL